jgi:hypothetical protein
VQAEARGLDRHISRRSFILQQGLIVFCRFAFLCLYFDPDIRLLLFRFDLHGSMDDYSQGKESFFRNLKFTSQDARAARVRLARILDTPILEYMALSSFHDILAIVAVGAGLDAP